MDWVRWVFLESTVALGVLLGLMNFFLLVYWRRTLRVRPLLVGMGLSVLLLVVQEVVVTRGEHVDRILSAIERDVERGQNNDLAGVLLPAFQAGRMDRDAFLAFVDEWQSRTEVRFLRRATVAFVEERAGWIAVEVGYQADVAAERYNGWLGSRWRIEFGRGGEGWGIGAIDPIRVAGQDVTWRELR